MLDEAEEGSSAGGCFVADLELGRMEDAVVCMVTYISILHLTACNNSCLTSLRALNRT